MRTLWSVIGVLAVVGVLGVSALGTRVQAASNLTEIEPNDTCASAQELGALDTHLIINGILDGSTNPYPYPNPTVTATPTAPAAHAAVIPAARAAATATTIPLTATPTSTPIGSTTPNIDFFRITATPGSYLQIALAGASSGAGSLVDPLVGTFDSNCNPLDAADSGGTGMDAQLIARVPNNGELVIAATSCCDYSFTSGGYGGGSYTLGIDTQPVIGSISGRLIDADSGAPLTSGVNYASVNLLRCPSEELSGCFQVAYAAPDDQGGFQITPQSAYDILPAGGYRILAYAEQYRMLATPIFHVGTDEHYALGDLAMSKPKEIGSISGRVVDSRTGNPIPSVSVSLEICDPIYSYCYQVNLASSDDEGGFSISGDMWGSPLYDNTYQVTLSLWGYDSLTSPQFSPAAGESTNLGDLRLPKIPLISSVSGRLLDAVSGEPLTSTSVNYSYLTLLECDSAGNCYNAVASTALDPSGNFRFDITNAWQQLRAGTYTISYGADQYVDGQGTPFTVAEGEDYTIDLRIQPYPIRLLNGSICTNIPARGGTCTYSLRLVNNQRKTVSLRAWNLVWSYNPASYGGSSFQPQDAQKIRLKPGESKLVKFSFDVPRNVAPNTSICTQYYVADDVKGFYFAPATQRSGFCVTKDDRGAFKPTTGDAQRELLQRMHGVPVDQRNRQ